MVKIYYFFFLTLLSASAISTLLSQPQRKIFNVFLIHYTTYCTANSDILFKASNKFQILNVKCASVNYINRRAKSEYNISSTYNTQKTNTWI